MYFPKSQIKTNLYTNGGEYQISSTGDEYKGPYFKTSTGDFYTGKNPDDKPVVFLTKLSNPLVNKSETSLNELSSQKVQYIDSTFDYLKSPITKPQLQTLPIRSLPSPTEGDYVLGEFQRYFLSKTNEPKFIEINKEQYEKYDNKEENVVYQLYQPLKFSWGLTGDKNNIYKVNEATVTRIEKNSKSPGFKSYFKGRFDQFHK